MRKMNDPYAIGDHSVSESGMTDGKTEIVLKVSCLKIVKSTGMVRISERVSSDDIRRVLLAAKPVPQISAIWIQAQNEVQFVLHGDSLIDSSTPPIGLAGQLLEATVSFVSISESSVFAWEHESARCDSESDKWAVRVVADEKVGAT